MAWNKRLRTMHVTSCHLPKSMGILKGLRVVRDPPPPPHVKTTEGDLLLPQLGRTHPVKGPDPWSRAWTEILHLQFSGENPWQWGRFPQPRTERPGVCYSSASSKGHAPWPLWALVLTSAGQAWALWCVRFLLELIDVYCYHETQNFHLYFPMLDWLLLCYCGLVRATHLVTVSRKGAATLHPAMVK